MYKKLFSELDSIPEPLQASHLPGLDGLRGVSIIMVVLSHIFISTPYKNSFPGDSGVEIFFVISGFLITTLLLKEKIETGNISLRKFYIRRIFRIIPVAYLYLIVLIVLNIYQNLNISSISFVKAFAFIQNLPTKGSYNWYTAHYWSLSVEEQFYFTFPFLLCYNLNKYIKLTLLIVLIIPIIGLLGYTKTGIFYSNKIVHIGTFLIVNLLGKTICILIGSLLSILLFKGVINLKNNLLTRYIGVVLFIWAILMHTETSIFNIPYCGVFLFPLIIGIVIVLNLNKESFFCKILSSSILIYIGLLSYSIYIWQQLFSKPNESILKNNSVILNLLVLFVLSNLSYFFYEKRFIKIKKHFTPTKPRI